MAIAYINKYTKTGDWSLNSILCCYEYRKSKIYAIKDTNRYYNARQFKIYATVNR